MRGRCLWLSLVLASLAALVLSPAAGAQGPGLPPATGAQGPGLPRTYEPSIIDSPEPRSSDSFGWGVTSGDLTGDGKLELLVAQAQTSSSSPPIGKGQVFIFDGATNRHIDTINPPEDNPDPTVQAPVLAFVYVETMPDIGSCPGGSRDADRICDLPTIAAGDGIPEILVASRNLRVNATNGAIPATAGDPRIGRTYVLDGATRAVLKRIDMPQADRMLQQQRNATPQFGRQSISPQALPPCAGSVAENNNAGVGQCPELPRSVRIGDLNLGGQPDIVITARNFVETGGANPSPSAAPGSHCRTSTTVATCTAGKAYAYAGELIAGTDPRAILDTPIYSIQNLDAQGPPGGQEFGGNVYRVGDVNNDGSPEFVIGNRSAGYPLRNPDQAFENIGVASVINGNTLTIPGNPPTTTPGGARIRLFQSPEPQPRSFFGGGFNGGRPPGDLGASTTPDLLLGAPLQNQFSSDDGVAWVFNPDPNAGGGAQQSWNFATLPDPKPEIGGNFSGATTGLGDLVTGPSAPANEVMIGGYHFDTFTEASNNAIMDVDIMNPELEKPLQTVPHPTGERGDGFGIGMVPMGDLNGDGFLDFAVSAYLANVQAGGQGRAYIFKSNNSPLPPLPSYPPPRADSPTYPQVFIAGRCANETLGTDKGETLRGTIAGDRIGAFAGNDVVASYQDEDCVDGGTGDDRLFGGPGNDVLLGRAGADRLEGADGRDRLVGGSEKDRLLGGFGRDFLDGAEGADRLRGGADEDRLFGALGNDRIVPGGGRDFVDGGAGRDRIFAVNGGRDDIVCGKGRDSVRADRSDKVDRSCERVKRKRKRQSRKKRSGRR